MKEKTAEQIVAELEGDKLKEVFHLAGKKLGHHGGVQAADDGQHTPPPPPPPPNPTLGD